MSLLDANNKYQSSYAQAHKNAEYEGETFGYKAIKAAKSTNPVDYKALDQRIADRPLYTQAKADIKHSEIFGDTWAWDSGPEWNSERFGAKEQKNRYEDVMKENKYDD